MPRKPKYSKEELIQVALEITREQGIQGITAKMLGTRLGTGATTIFTHFDSVEAIKNTVSDEAKKIYEQYIQAGLKMTPQLKAVAIQFIKFSINEPQLFHLLFMTSQDTHKIIDFIAKEGHFDEYLNIMQKTFSLTKEDTIWLYQTIWTYVYGVATLCSNRVCRFNDEELSEMIGSVTRSFLLGIGSRKDERTKIVPKEGLVLDSDFI